uniref:TGF-beta family profile domain-containing protein n=1 Tax=Loxodonta africana TaxID=9785 RepID=G3TR48_LOXAF
AQIRTSTTMPLSGPTPLHLCPMLLLLLSLLPPEGALSSVLERSPGLRGFPDALPGLNASRFREMRKRYDSLMNQLRVNQSWENSSPDPSTASVVWILTPELSQSMSRAGMPGLLLGLIGNRAQLCRGLPRKFRDWRTALKPQLPSNPQTCTSLGGLRSLGEKLAPVPFLPAVRTGPGGLVHLRIPGAALSAGRPLAPPTPGLAERRHCCGVQSRRVTLEELGWADWVLAPRELDVRVCVGACPPRFRPASAHARIKARLHDRNPGSAPEPCCVPASFEPLALLHQDSEGRVTLTSYDDILVKDCHCA